MHPEVEASQKALVDQEAHLRDLTVVSQRAQEAEDPPLLRMDQEMWQQSTRDL